jgi:hypothetical protein
MARIYANENFPFPVVEELRRLGHDVLTTFESGRAGQRFPDDEMLAFAVSARRAMLTHNRRHFVHLHGKQPAHYGIIVCSVDPDAIEFAQRIHSAIQAHPKLEGQLVRVNRPQSGHA